MNMRYLASLKHPFLKQFVRGKSDLKAYKFWKEELKKGYFDDFGEFRNHKGKLFLADADLSDESNSDTFPTTEFINEKGNTLQFPLKEEAARATLACISFREGAKTMTDSWINAFQSFRDASSKDCFKIHMVEHKIMSLWPFRSMILGSQRSDSSSSTLFLFGDHPTLYDDLNITNRLTSYVFLLDKKGLIRWRACGMASEDEIKSLKKAHGRLNSID